MPRRYTKPSICSVYRLMSSRDFTTRYIGQTVATLRVRLRRHHNEAKTKNTHVAKWIRKEVGDGHLIFIVLIEADAVWCGAERYWIALYRNQGADLTNLTDGGEGTLGSHHNKGKPHPWTSDMNRSRKGIPTGHVISDEAKERLATIQRNRKGWSHTDEAIKKISDAGRERQTPETTKQILSEKAKARVLLNPEQHAKALQLAHDAMPSTLPPEWRKAISEGHKNKPCPPERRAKIAISLKAFHERKRIHAAALLEEPQAE